MTVTAKPLVQAAHAANAQTTVYTAPAGTRTILDKVTGQATLAATLTINVVASGGAAAATNVIVAKTFAIGDVYTFPEVVGHDLNPGDFVSIISTVAAAIVFRMSGREVT